jgi:3-oxoacyl-[acyl-carrier protein] reductase
MMDLEGKVALVTGGAQGIGKVTALHLASKGADVAVSDINMEGSLKTAEEIEGLGRRGLAIEGDVSNPADAEIIVAKTVERLGGIDILVNNAGITRDKLLLRMTEEDWDAVLNVNLKGTFNCTKAAVKYMVKHKSGRVVNIASVVGEMGNAGQANYAASKAGIIGLTKSVAREYAKRGINVNAIAPGYIETPMTEALSEKVKEELKAQIPMARLGTPSDVANAVYFLVSDASSYITGHVLNVNGGIYM